MSDENEKDQAEYVKAMEEELDRVWDLLKRLVDASEKPAGEEFLKALEEVRDWVEDTA